MAEIKERTKKNGQKSYTVCIRIKGHPSENATFDLKSTAKQWALERELEIKQGKHLKLAEAKRYTLNELIDRYVEVELPQRKSDRKKFITQTNWWKRQIGAYMLADITPSLLSRCKDTLSTESCKFAKNGRSCRTNATVNRYLACLSTILTKAAKEWEWIEENPMLKVSKLKEPNGRTRFLSDDEKDRLLIACRQISYELYLLVLIAVLSGARKGEILGLKWRDVDFKNKMFYFYDTKNGDNRGVPISNILINELKKAAKIRNIKSDYIFINKFCQNKKFFDGQFVRAKKMADIQDFKFHDLRHTAASYFAMEGASLIELADILGHKTLSMVKRYAHLTKKHTANLIERMNQNRFGSNSTVSC